MKEIDDKMIEKAVRNLKSLRRLKLFNGIIGFIGITQAVFLGYILYRYIQKPWHSSGTSVFLVANLTFFTGFTLFMGVRLLCTGLFRNYKDIILEYLAERYLEQQKKDKPEKESG